jgi:hypothetical protein
VDDTFLKPLSRIFGTSTLAMMLETYRCTTSVPSMLDSFVNATVAVLVSAAVPDVFDSVRAEYLNVE